MPSASQQRCDEHQSEPEYNRLFGGLKTTKHRMPRGGLKMALLISLLALGAVAGEGEPPRVGDRAPDFALADQTGSTVQLSAFRGKKSVVLAFYIKAFTPT